MTDRPATARAAASLVSERFVRFARESYADVRAATDTAPTAARVAKAATAVAIATVAAALALFVGGLIGLGPATLLAAVLLLAAAAGELAAVLFVRAALSRVAFGEARPVGKAVAEAPPPVERPAKVIRRRPALRG